MIVRAEIVHRMGVPAEMTSQRTQTAQHPGQPIAMSEKSSTFALAFEQRVEGGSETSR